MIRRMKVAARLAIAATTDWIHANNDRSCCCTSFSCCRCRRHHLQSHAFGRMGIAALVLRPPARPTLEFTAHLFFVHSLFILLRYIYVSVCWAFFCCYYLFRACVSGRIISSAHTPVRPAIHYSPSVLSGPCTPARQHNNNKHKQTHNSTRRISFIIVSNSTATRGTADEHYTKGGAPAAATTQPRVSSFNFIFVYKSYAL